MSPVIATLLACSTEMLPLPSVLHELGLLIEMSLMLVGSTEMLPFDSDLRSNPKPPVTLRPSPRSETPPVPDTAVNFTLTRSSPLPPWPVKLTPPTPLPAEEADTVNTLRLPLAPSTSTSRLATSTLRSMLSSDIGPVISSLLLESVTWIDKSPPTDVRALPRPLKNRTELVTFSFIEPCDVQLQGPEAFTVSATRLSPPEPAVMTKLAGDSATTAPPAPVSSSTEPTAPEPLAVEFATSVKFSPRTPWIRMLGLRTSMLSAWLLIVVGVRSTTCSEPPTLNPVSIFRSPPSARRLFPKALARYTLEEDVTKMLLADTHPQGPFKAIDEDCIDMPFSPALILKRGETVNAPVTAPQSK